MWNHGEPALLKVPPLRTFSDLAGRAGLRTLLNWATETPDLVATVPGRAIWGRAEAKITFKQIETVNPLLCAVSRFNAMNYVTDLHATKQLFSSLSPSYTCCALVQQQSDRPISWEASEVVTDACCKLAGKSTLWLVFFKWTTIHNKYVFSLALLHMMQYCRLGFQRKGRNEKNCLQNLDSSRG